MECPVEKELSVQGRYGNLYRIIDAGKATIASGILGKDIDQIVQAINSHEKFKTALTKIRNTEVSDDKECDAYGALGICKDIAIEALKEVEQE